MEGWLDWRLFPTTPSHWMFYTHQFQLSIFNTSLKITSLWVKLLFMLILNKPVLYRWGQTHSCIMGNLGQFTKKQSCKIYSQSDFTFGDETHKKVKCILFCFFSLQWCPRWPMMQLKSMNPSIMTIWKYPLKKTLWHKKLSLFLDFFNLLSIQSFASLDFLILPMFCRVCYDFIKHLLAD